MPGYGSGDGVGADAVLGEDQKEAEACQDGEEQASIYDFDGQGVEGKKFGGSGGRRRT